MKTFSFNKLLNFSAITSIIICFFSFQSLAQSSVSNQILSKSKASTWQLLYSNDVVQINYKYAACNLPSAGTNNEYYYLQIVNKTNKKIQVEWLAEYWYNSKCIGCGNTGNENVKHIMLLPDEKKEGSCSQTSDQALAIFSKMLTVKIKSELTDFNLKNIKIINL